MNKRIVLSIDPSVNSTGVYLSGYEQHLLIKPPAKFSFPKKLKYIYDAVRNFLKRENGFHVDLAIIEAPFPKYTKGQDLCIRAAGVMELVLAEKEIPVVRVPVQTWKSITGMNIYKKKNAADKKKYLEAINEKVCVNFETTDTADAFMIHDACKHILKVPEVCLTDTASKLKNQLKESLKGSDQWDVW